jgi:hypothetical protein
MASVRAMSASLSTPNFCMKSCLSRIAWYSRNAPNSLLRHADGLEQQRIGRDVDRLHVGEGRQHHLHLGRFEDAPYFSM